MYGFGHMLSADGGRIRQFLEKLCSGGAAPAS